MHIPLLFPGLSTRGQCFLLYNACLFSERFCSFSVFHSSTLFFYFDPLMAHHPPPPPPPLFGP